MPTPDLPQPKTKDQEVSAAEMNKIFDAIRKIINHTHVYTDSYNSNCNCNCNCSRGIL
jgi:hypothetical protein